MNAVFYTTQSGATAYGVCEPGYFGTPKLNCTEVDWDTQVFGDECIRNLLFSLSLFIFFWFNTKTLLLAITGLYCSATTITYKGIPYPYFPNTLADSTVTVQCPPGQVGTQSRKCLIDGTWDTATDGTCQDRTIPIFFKTFIKFNQS